LLLSALWQVPDALLRKSLRFRRRMTADIGRAAARGGASIALAVAGAGPWAIVGGMIAGDAVYTVAVWAMVDYRPRADFWRVGSGDLRPLVSYGAPAAGAAILSYFLWNVDYLIIGRLLGTEQLGYYLVAFRLPEMAIVYVFWIFSRVAFPTYSRVRTEPQRLVRGYLRALRLQSIYGIGIGVAIAVSAPVIVPLVFGGRWAPAVVPMALLALYAAFRALGQSANDVYVATGHPRLSAGVAALRLAALVPALLLAARWGIVGVAAAQAALALFYAILMHGFADRLLHLSVRSLLRTLLPGLAAGIGIAVAATAARANSLPLLGTAVVAGGILGLIVAAIADRSFAREARSLTRVFA
jgi:PST family polysaccharide transporter